MLLVKFTNHYQGYLDMYLINELSQPTSELLHFQDNFIVVLLIPNSVSTYTILDVHQILSCFIVYTNELCVHEMCYVH